MGNSAACSTSKKKHVNEAHRVPNPDFTVPSTMGFSISNEPAAEDLFVKCPFCNQTNFNDCLGNPILCYCCMEYFSSHENKAYSSHTVDQLDEAFLANQNFHFQRSADVPYIQHVILTCERSSIPSSYIRNGRLNFLEIQENILIPYFEKQTRVLQDKISFKVGNMEFKVFSCSPTLGRVAKETRIKCYHSHDRSSRVRAMVVASITNQPCSLSRQDVLSVLLNRRVPMVVSADEVLHVRQFVLKVVNCIPKSGVITQATALDVLNTSVPNVKKLTLLTSKEQHRSLMQRNVGDLGVYLLSKVVKPFFHGADRYSELQKEFEIDEGVYMVHSQEPPRGIVTETTLININLSDAATNNPRPNPTINSTVRPTQRTTIANQLRFPQPEVIPSRVISVGQDRLAEPSDMHHYNIINNPVYRSDIHYQFRGTGGITPEESVIRYGEEDGLAEARQLESDESGGHDEEEKYNHRAARMLLALPPDLLLRRQDVERTPSGIRRRPNPLGLPEISGGDNYQSSGVINDSEDLVMPQLLQLRDRLMSLRMRAASLLSNGDSPGIIPSQVTSTANKMLISRLPTRKIQLSFLREKKLENDHIKCMVCLMEYCEDEEVRTLPCLHYFHKECIDNWLGVKLLCPICKTPINQ